MRAPRLNAGIFADDTELLDLGPQLREIGHHVTYFSDVEDATQFELVVITVPDNRLEDVIEGMSARARPGQIFLHTSAGHGTQVFDSLETSGAVVCAAHPLTDDLWAVGAADELGETIVELLVGELGGQALMVPDTQRLRLAAALTYRSFEATLRNDAFLLLSEAIGNEERALEIIGGFGEERPLDPVRGPAGMAAQQRAIEDPGTARVFRDLARRAAEQTGAHDVELWAMGDN
ncbi:hypothetical protein [Corynebacterium doosanense]|uniref:Uncharacterized protein n=1 Tax=Corynebacterium doosanense CAU 212 = DSM 45436 TaxID=558173 RepID=A0A097II87_9CORY|nr:hypothetical protein [Corynebacterium doosanense]AIT61847.1 hypothetical protein CDOO_11690 [Corynebacterium doosanense CAU 212 = DSM 45436]